MAVDAQPDEVPGEVGEEDADVRVVHHVAEAGQHAVAPVLAVSKVRSSSTVMNPAGPAPKLQPHSPERLLVAVNAISIRPVNWRIARVSPAVTWVA